MRPAVAVAFVVAAGVAFFAGAEVGGRVLLPDERAGWEPVPISTLARESDGALDLVTLEVPRRFVHDGLVRPDDVARLQGKKTSPLPAGAPLTWAHLADLVFEQRVTACTAAVREAMAPEVAQAVERALVFEAAGPEVAQAVPTREVLVLGRAVQAGATLTDADLAASTVPPELLTASWIDASRRAEVVGRRVVAPLVAGAPLWWQMLETPGSVATCVLRVTAARDEATQRLSASAAKAWVEKAGATW